MDPVVTFVGSLIGGGIGSALINFWGAWFSVKSGRKFKLLDDQLKELYAPLFYLVVQNDKLLELIDRFRSGLRVIHEDLQRELLVEPLNQTKVSRIKKEFDMSAGVADDYRKLLKENHEKIGDLLNSKFAYIDPSDVEVFTLFFEHYVRASVEMTATGDVRTEGLMRAHVGEISHLRHAFVQCVKTRFVDKRQELTKHIS